MKLSMLHSNTSKVTILKQNEQKSSLLSKQKTQKTKNKQKKTPTKEQKTPHPNQKANAVAQSLDGFTEAKNVTTAIIQVKYMRKFKHATFKLRQK